MSCGATAQLGSRTPFLLGCAQLLHAPDLVQQARDEGLEGGEDIKETRTPGGQDPRLLTPPSGETTSYLSGFVTANQQLLVGHGEKG